MMVIWFTVMQTSSLLRFTLNQEKPPVLARLRDSRGELLTTADNQEFVQPRGLPSPGITGSSNTVKMRENVVRDISTHSHSWQLPEFKFMSGTGRIIEEGRKEEILSGRLRAVHSSSRETCVYSIVSAHEIIRTRRQHTFLHTSDLRKTRKRESWVNPT